MSRRALARSWRLAATGWQPATMRGAGAPAVAGGEAPLGAQPRKCSLSVLHLRRMVLVVQLRYNF
ncbi:MAG: hypothetical protein ACYDC0_16015, partial [Acidimicrobiales bacterium]